MHVMTDNIKKLIKEKADRIKMGLVKDGCIANLFGEPFDANDPDSVILALHYRYQEEIIELRSKMERLEILGVLRR
jgi:hypothetical protein